MVDLKMSLVKLRSMACRLCGCGRCQWTFRCEHILHLVLSVNAGTGCTDVVTEMYLTPFVQVIDDEIFLAAIRLELEIRSNKLSAFSRCYLAPAPSSVCLGRKNLLMVLGYDFRRTISSKVK
jgi:hypothetical protein